MNTMLDNIRLGLYAILVILSFLMWTAWNTDYPKKQTIASQTQANVTSSERIAPALANSFSQTNVQDKTATSQTAVSSIVPAPLAKGEMISITTDVFNVKIDTRGGDIVEVNLLKYPAELGSSTPFLLMNDDAKTRYIAESGLLSTNGPDTSKEQALYTTPNLTYTLEPNQRNLLVKLNWERNGIKVTKIFTFVRDSYQIQVAYQIDNQSQQTWQGSLYTQLMRTNTPPSNHSGLMNLTTYFGAAISTPEKRFEKIPFKSMQETTLKQMVQGGWAAMIQHYFISAWVPEKTAPNSYYTHVTSSGLYTIGMVGQPLTVAPGASSIVDAKLYAGPAIADRLEAATPGLQLTIDYGWFWFISVAIFWMMQKIYNVIGNWGWSIVLVTLIIKLLFYQLSNKSYRSMSAMKKLQPKIERLKERLGDDRQKLTQETLNLYRQEKVNPMSGCLPILIQIPVFIALYWVLVESVQLRQAPFILWINDLSKPDPYYILPLLMGISMFLQQRLNPPPPDPMQAKVMMMMPIVFTILFANFPAGLMLYWFVNNSLSFLQQWHIMHRMEKEVKTKKA